MSTTHNSLKLLSLDGGGVRGLSAIIMLEHIMESANAHRKNQGLDALEPWQMFDMIGGTSTGGIIAIMLGRLRMTLKECREAYEKLSTDAFTPLHSKMNFVAAGFGLWKAGPTFDVDKLEQAIRHVISSHSENCGNEPAKALLQEPNNSADSNRPCKVFVACTHEDITELAIFRSYNNHERIRRKVFDQCLIWEACRATSAAPTFFPPIVIGEQKFLDGALKHNNPVHLVLREAKDVWGDSANDAILISLGTGNAPDTAFAGSAPQIVKKLQEIATQTEETANVFLGGEGRGMAQKENYVDNEEPRPKTEACVKKLSETAAKVTAEMARLEIWKLGTTARETYHLPSEEFTALHEDDLDQDFPNMAFWYREKLDMNKHYPLGVEVEHRFQRPGGVMPVGDTVLSLRRICNLIVRGRFRYIKPGRYQVKWIFWFPAGRLCPSSSNQVPACYIPDGVSTENSVLQRIFPSVVAGQHPPERDSSFFYPWTLLLSAGRPRDFNALLETDIDVGRHPLAAPVLLSDGFTEQRVDPGLWNTKRNTGWCEIPGKIVDVDDGGRIAFVITKAFERKWFGGFSFGGVRLVPI